MASGKGCPLADNRQIVRRQIDPVELPRSRSMIHMSMGDDNLIGLVRKLLDIGPEITYSIARIDEQGSFSALNKILANIRAFCPYAYDMSGDLFAFKDNHREPLFTQSS